MEVNFILFSNLGASNGGVESWLNNFLQLYTSDPSKYATQINVYFYEEEGSAVVKIANARNTAHVRFYPIRIKAGSGLLSSFKRLWIYHKACMDDILQRGERGVIASIGSYPTGVMMDYLLRIKGGRKSFKHVIWLRTIMRKHILTLATRKFKALILRMEKRALQRADLVIANGWDTQKDYIQYYNVDSFVIPNAIDSSIYNCLKPIQDIAPTPFRIAFIGRFFNQKGIFNFLQAITFFNQEYPHLKDRVSFVFVGWGESNVEAAIGKLENAVLVGKIPNTEMPAFLDTIHCGVALTKYLSAKDGGSGVSNNLLELMAAGKIIIAYDNPIFRQFERQDIMTYVAEDDDVQLGHLLGKIVAQPDAYYSYAHHAKEYVKSFSIEAHVNRFISQTDSLCTR